MALELEKLSHSIQEMAQQAIEQAQHHHELLDQMEKYLHTYADDWDSLERSLDIAKEEIGEKLLRSAKPGNQHTALTLTQDAPDPPEQAILTAVDGSQIIPNRHDPFTYYVINVGAITYFHGQSKPPQTSTHPRLVFPQTTLAPETYIDDSTIISMRRDLAEITTLANIASNWQDTPHPNLAILDQRLIYWPAGGARTKESRDVLTKWQNQMDNMRQANALLVGYIDAPLKRSVLTMLASLIALEKDRYALKRLIDRVQSAIGLSDADLFHRVLKEPGQRSKVFADVSEHNTQFASSYDGNNEVYFFYFNPGRGNIARIDIPKWVATNPDHINTIHALLYSQCQIIHNYPYLITRADEIAVISFQDKEYLETMIANAMQQHHPDFDFLPTAKQSSKAFARSSKTRHTL